MPKFAVLELNESEAKLLVASKNKKGPLTLESAHVVPIGDLGKDEEGLAQRRDRIRKELEKVRLSGAIGGIVLPKQQAIVRTAQLPSIEPSEIDSMVQFEAEKFIPFNAERHVVSHSVIRSEGERGSHVLLAAVDGPVIDNAVDVAKAIGLEPVLAEVSSVSLSRIFLGEAKLPDDPHASILLINLGKHTAEISILRDGALEAARSQSVSLERIADENAAAGRSWEDVEVETPSLQEWIVRLMRFVRQTIEFATREHDVPTPKVAYLCGEGTRIDGLANAISMNLGMSVVTFAPGLGIQRKPEVGEEMLPAMANAIGLLVRLVQRDEAGGKDDGRINLLPPLVLQQQAAAESRLLLMVSATMVFITVVLVYLAFDMQAKHSADLADRYAAYNKDMRPLVEDIELKQERLEIIETIKKEQASPLYVLDQLSTYPTMGPTHNKGRLTLTNFKFTQTGDVVLGGMALDLEDVSLFADFVQKLSWNEKPLFGEVGIPQSQPSDSLGRNRPKVWTFTINCKMYIPDSDKEEE